ncbi:hypothetical protein [Methanococcus maripaludis]|uniref:Uncharacterized protein n=2 Tax=Methanococcus maripaludis TaxID=39152 RepID=A0A7J9PGX5_METMI|nr:hypothetical protein [Methanococcus maripaludis]MBA2862044.1 hypothetical protein [Methanococcus maripaludis]
MMAESGIDAEYERIGIPESIIAISNLFMCAIKDFENVGTFKPFPKIYQDNSVFSEEEDFVYVVRKQKIKLGDLQATSTNILKDDSLVVLQILDAKAIDESQIIEELKKGNVVEYSKERNFFYSIPAENY